jgi:hypothetical protein
MTIRGQGESGAAQELRIPNINCDRGRGVSNYCYPLVPDRIRKIYYLELPPKAAAFQIAERGDQLKNLLEKFGNVKVHDESVGISVPLGPVLTETTHQPWLNIPFRIDRDHRPVLRVDYNVTREIICRHLNDDTLSNEAKKKISRAQKNKIRINGLPKRNSIADLAEVVDLQQEVVNEVIRQVDSEVNEFCQERMLDILTSIPSIADEVSDLSLGWGWQTCELAQVMRIEAADIHWSTIVAWVSQHLSTVGLTNASYGKRFGFFGNSDTWGKTKAGQEFRDRHISDRGFRTLDAYKRFSEGHCLAINYFLGTNRRSTDLDAHLALYPEELCHDGVKRHILHFEIRPRPVSFRKGLLKNHAASNPIEVVDALKPYLLPEPPRDWLKENIQPVNLLVDQYFKVAGFTRTQVNRLRKGLAILASNSKASELSNFLVEPAPTEKRGSK